jgi:uncharacterized protein GlcG (DUF336 family)
MTKRIHAAAFAAVLSSLLVSGPGLAENLPSKPVLTQALAQKMISACFAAQEEAGYSNVNAVVVDDGGRLIAAARQDGACKACTEIAHNKAITAALYAAPTRAFADMSFGEKRDGVNAALPGAAFVPGLVAFAGGLPVTTANSDVIGAIGVSGASEDQDESCAQAGLDAISESLN